jgi:hypothetical protein
MNVQNPTLKKAMIEALEKSLGVVTTACKSVGISRGTHYDWLNNDEDYKRQVEDLKNVALDFVESKLFKNINEGKETSIIFYLNNQGLSRGYSRKQEVIHSGGFVLNETKTYEKPKETEEE